MQSRNRLHRRAHIRAAQRALARIAGGAVVAAGLALQTGCGPGPDEMNMQPPARPVELDRLEPLVGQWECTAECRMGSEEPAKTCKISHSAAWECDKWVLVEREEGTMEGQTYRGIGVWSWDPQRGRYRVWWTDNYGEADEGWATYDEATQTFRIRSDRMQGTIRLVDRNTNEWTYCETTGGLFPRTIMEMKGTSKRR